MRANEQSTLLPMPVLREESSSVGSQVRMWVYGIDWMKGASI